MSILSNLEKMLSYLDPLLPYFNQIVLVGMAILFLLVLVLWRQLNRVLKQQVTQSTIESEAQAAQVTQLQQLERALVRELAGEREIHQRALLQIQERLMGQSAHLQQNFERRFGEFQKETTQDLGSLKRDLSERFERFQHRLSQELSEHRLVQQEALTKGVEGIGRQLTEGLTLHTQELGKRVDGLTNSTDQRLKEISGQVEKRLAEGFEKTTETFTRVLEHLSRIDEAQKRITELSTNVVSLQQVLSDKRSRGAFGEVQLNTLVGNLLPERSYALQHGLSNGTRVDCMIFLPDPTGDIAIDAKFPLESYQKMTDNDALELDRTRAASQFKQDIKKHINDIANKYIIPEETGDGAVMFIPAESIFAEIHSHFRELVEEAYSKRVWMVSPTTMMAVLTTARAVLKDAATREQVHVIQQHLNLLSKDFGRFQNRMDKLATHIRQAHKDVDEVNISAQKISKRFGQIEKVELEEMEQDLRTESAPLPDKAVDSSGSSRSLEPLESLESRYQDV